MEEINLSIKIVNMKTKKEIENICGNIVDSESINDQFKQSVYEGCVLGYTQCQEDMQKDVEYWQGESDHWHQQAMEMSKYKYTEEDIRRAMKYASEITNNKMKYVEDYINSLNKQN